MNVCLHRRARALEAERGVHHAGLEAVGDVGTSALAVGLSQQVLFLSIRPFVALSLTVNVDLENHRS